jgi:transcriptional regulator with XRE-family HTH domain
MKERIASLKDRLQYAMDIREKKAVDLVKDLKIPKSAVSQYLSGKSQKMDSERLNDICIYLNVSEPWLLGYDVPMERMRKEIEEKPVEMAERHFEIMMDEDIAEIFDEFKSLDSSKKKIVKDLIHNLAQTEV